MSVCVGVSYVYMLKSIGDRAPPCGTLNLNWRCVDPSKIAGFRSRYDVLCTMLACKFQDKNLVIVVYVV